MKQAENNVIIRGLLLSTDIVHSETADGREYVRGTATIKVRQNDSDGKQVISEIPVKMFAMKKTKAGKANPAYKSISDLEDMNSFAATQNEKETDYVELTSGSLETNMFVGQDGRLVEYEQISGAFFKKVSKDKAANVKDEALFSTKVVVLGHRDEVKDDEPTGRLELKGAIVQYGDKVDEFKFVVETPAAIAHIKNYWEKGATIPVSGVIYYVAGTRSKTKIDDETEMGFGEFKPIVYNTLEKRFVITAGTKAGLEGEAAYQAADIKEALENNKARRAEALRKTKEVKTAAKPSEMDAYGFGD